MGYPSQSAGGNRHTYRRERSRQKFDFAGDFRTDFLYRQDRLRGQNLQQVPAHLIVGLGIAHVPEGRGISAT